METPEFNIVEFITVFQKIPFNSEIVSCITEYLIKNKLELPKNFKKEDIKTVISTEPYGWKVWFCFPARKINSDELLKDQFEYFISNL